MHFLPLPLQSFVFLSFFWHELYANQNKSCVLHYCMKKPKKYNKIHSESQLIELFILTYEEKQKKSLTCIVVRS